MRPDLTVVVGGGAAGICAAISAARGGCRVILCEKTARLGKKILASGNGRCNLLNDDISEACYNPSSRDLVRSVLAKFGQAEAMAFFKDLGLRMYSQNGRIFPITNQAASVLKVLEMEIERLAVPVEYGFDCTGLSLSADRIIVSSRSGKSIECGRVVLTGGGKSYPALGSDGSMHAVATNLGHTIVTPVPCAVPLAVNDGLCHLLQGQRISASVKAIIDGTEADEVIGELLFTKYGLSGTAILDVSRAVSVALNRDGRTNVCVSVDMAPFVERESLRNDLAKRRQSGWAPEDMLVGILPNKFGPALKTIFAGKDLNTIVNSLKSRRFRVTATRGWNEAEFTSGGVDVREVIPGTLESRLKKGVYFAGEVLDVDGKRGGYNLAWAWASGMVAGRAG